MNLLIDIGNTMTKVAVQDQGKMIFLERYPHIGPADIENIFEEYPIRSGIVGSVKEIPGWLQALVSNRIPLHVLNAESLLPIKLNYLTPKTLGADRIAAVVGAHHLHPQKNILVIETGTCITYDFIDASGIYQGGGISPGIHLRFSALHNFTEKLPLVTTVCNPALIGKSTESSIQSGVINGIIAELNGIISVYESNYENLTVILSGGDLDYFDKNLKNNIFAVPNIVLTGLNIILEFNDKN